MYRWLVSNVFRCIGRIVTIFALCSAIGLHWLTLQSIAWTTMLIDYSKRAPLCRAISQTFDGAHPCSLCQVVNAGKSSEKKSDPISAAGRADKKTGIGAPGILLAKDRTAIDSAAGRGNMVSARFGKSELAVDPVSQSISLKSYVQERCGCPPFLQIQRVSQVSEIHFQENR